MGMTLPLMARTLASFALIAFLAASGAERAAAQTGSDARAGAESALQAGLAAQKARQHDQAIQHLSRAINTGALSRKQMTYALYRRAISNRTQRQPAQAISDLNAALYFKGDLSSNDRADAIEERMKAFKDAGLPATPVASASNGSQWSPSSTTASSPDAAAPRVISSAPPRVLDPVRIVEPPRTTVSSIPLTQPILAPETPAQAAVMPQFNTRVTAAAQTPIRARPARSYLPEAVDRGVGVPKAPRFIQSASKRVAPPAPLPNWQTATNAAPPAANRITAPSTLTPAVAASTVAPAAPPARVVTGDAPVAVRPPAFRPIVEPSSGTADGAASLPVGVSSIATGSIAQPKVPQSEGVSAAAVAPVAVSAGAPGLRPGRFEIEVAVLRSRFRADALAQQLMVQYPGSFFAAAKKAHVAEVAGQEGAEFAVRFGPYESRDAATSMCGSLRGDGFDCGVVHLN